MLDAAADHVAFGNGDDVGHTVSGVDDRARQGALGDLCTKRHDKPKGGGTYTNSGVALKNGKSSRTTGGYVL